MSSPTQRSTKARFGWGEEADEWTKASVLGVRLRELWPGIYYRGYGKSKLGRLLASYPEHSKTKFEGDVQEFRLVRQ